MRQMRQKRTTIRERYDTRPTRRGARAAEPSHPRLTLNSCNFLTISPDSGILFRDFCSIPESFVSLKTYLAYLVDTRTPPFSSYIKEILCGTCWCHKPDQCTIIILIDLIPTACSPIDGWVRSIISPCFILYGNVKELRVQLYSFHLIPLGAKPLNGIELGSSCTIGKCSTHTQ